MADQNTNDAIFKNTVHTCVQVALQCENGDPVKLVDFIIGEFVGALDGQLIGTENAARLIVAALDELREATSQ